MKVHVRKFSGFPASFSTKTRGSLEKLENASHQDLKILADILDVERSGNKVAYFSFTFFLQMHVCLVLIGRAAETIVGENNGLP